MSLLVLGSRKAGKSSIVNLIAGNSTNGAAPAPTESVNWESFQIKSQHFRSLEIGGLADTGQRWQDIIKPPQGVILVVDGAGRTQIKQAQKFFDQILSEEKLRGVPVLVLANKSDIKIYNDELIDELKIMEVSDREIFVQATCALDGQGIAQGFDKLIQNIKAPDQQSSGYSFQAQPQVVKNQAQYKNEGEPEEFAQKSQQTFTRLMQNQEIKKMHPTHQESEYIRMEQDRIQLENMHNQLQNFQTNKQQMTPYDIQPSPNPQIDVNLEFFLTDNKNTIVPEEQNTDIQTDDFLKPPPSPQYIPQKTGIDKYTQVEDVRQKNNQLNKTQKSLIFINYCITPIAPRKQNELFDFDREVTPIVDVIVTQTLEEVMKNKKNFTQSKNQYPQQSLLEIEQERELEQMKEFKNQFNERREKAQKHEQKVLDDEFRVIQQKKDLKSRFERKESQIKETLRVTQAYGMAKMFLRYIKPNSFDFLYQNGYYQNQLQNNTASHFMDWLVDEVVKELDIKKTINNNLEGMYDVVSLPSIQTQAKPTWDIINKQKAIHEVRRTNWSNNKRFVRFFYKEEIFTPSLFFQHFSQFIDNTIDEYEKSYKAKLEELQAKIDAVEIQPEDKQKLIDADFPPVTANYFSFNITKVKRIAFTLAHDCFYITDPKERNLELQCAVLDKEGNVIYRINKENKLLADDNKSIKYKTNIRDQKVKVAQDECILISHQALPEDVETILLFTRVRNIQIYAQSVDKNPDFNKNARYGLVDFEYGIEIEHTNLVPTHKFDDLAKAQDGDQPIQEQSSLVLCYSLTRSNGWKFENIKAASQGLFEADIEEYESKIGQFYHHITTQSPLVGEKHEGKEGEENKGDLQSGHNIGSKLYNIIQVDLGASLEATQNLFREKLEAQDPALIATCPDGYEIQIRNRPFTRVEKLQQTRNAFHLTIFRIPPPPPEKEEQEVPADGGEHGNEENQENPPDQ